jgi:predicted Ser/Thr protein kinase
MLSESYLETLDPKLGRIVKQYLEAVERGENPSPEDWVQRYPQFANPLRDFFASRQQLGDLLQEAKASGTEQTMDSAVGPPNAAWQNQNPTSRLRYFGDYELESEIARGGMGVVFRARQVSLNRPVAVKMILSGELASPDDVARFRTEAEAAANLDHPAIVPIYEIGEREGQHYFSMKFVDGESLSQRLQKTEGKSLTRKELEKRVELVIAVARGIHYAHQRGIIHRDLKPANILIDSAGQPHITDFGLARRTTEGSDLTRTGAIVGTPSYMAPEQALGSGKSATTAVDIYGLGAILYATLTGQPPFEGQNPLETILQVQKEPPVPPSRLNSAVDNELEVICLKCLEKDPDARYRSAGELADDLARWSRGEPIQAMPPNAARLFWRWLATHFKAAACVLVIGAITGTLICVPAIHSQADNLGGYALIYRGSFPAEESPWILKALEGFPRWLGIALLPLMLVSYFSMGWFTDRLVKPQDLAGAMLCGLGVGTAAAITAFLFCIGWVTIIQVAVWPSQPDLELLVAEISKDTTFSDGQTISKKYPGDINGQPVYTRYVMKKALADMQARIPIALWYGFGFSACVLLLPATLQTVAAQYLRSRGDRWWWQILHLAELSIPTSLMLMALGMLLWNAPTLGVQLLLLPLIGLATLHPLRQTHIMARRAIIATIAILFVILLYSGRAAFFSSNSGGINFAHTAAGTIAAVLAVTCRFRWWKRLLLYGTWVAILFFSDSVKFGSRSSLDPGMALDRQILISAVGSGFLLAMVALFFWMGRRKAAPTNR